MMKVKISKTEVYGSSQMKGSSGKAIRPATITDACTGVMPTRRQPQGFVGIWDYSGSGNVKKSPTSKPGNGR
jgi:hypothetical protein